MSKNGRSGGKKTTLTKNQAMKAQRASKQAERMREVLNNQKLLEESRQNKSLNKDEIKTSNVKSIVMHTSVIKRRKSALERLKVDLKDIENLISDDNKEKLSHYTDRMKKEISILESRIK